MENGQPTEDIIASLRELLEAEQRTLREKEQELVAIRDARDRYRRAIEALSGETRPALRTQSQQSNRRPSQAVLDDVLAALTKAGEPLTLEQTIEMSGRSHDTVRRALIALRRDEKIRRAGRSEDRAYQYTVMP